MEPPIPAATVPPGTPDDVAPDAVRAARTNAYENPRPDVQALVPTTARRILDVGCSSGALGAALRSRGGGVQVVGLEADAGYAADARARLDRVVVLDLDEVGARPELLGDQELGRFDVLVAADVLEHLKDPGAVLAALLELVEADGHVVVSLPNVRYWETFWQLGFHGTFPRRSSGIFDRTHLRWFTLHDAHVLLQEAGLEVIEVVRIVRPRPTGPSDGRVARLVARLPGRTFLTFQHLLLARRA